MASPFALKKSAQLAGCDLSRKGSIDKEAQEIVNVLNSIPFYCTTSSCSGRVIVYEWNDKETTERYSCNWLLVSHEPFSLESLKNALAKSLGNASVRFEPFILHVSCETLRRARLLHTASLEVGFKNSGLTISKNGTVMLAIRSTIFLEVPLTLSGKLLVSDEYLKHIVDVVNEKFALNSENILKLLAKLQHVFNNNKME